MFMRYGRITDIRLNRDRMSGRCKGFAFVAMAREEEVDEVSAAMRRRGKRGEHWMGRVAKMGMARGGGEGEEQWSVGEGGAGGVRVLTGAPC